MMLVNGVNKAEGGEEREPSDGALLEDSQNLLCLKCYKELNTLFKQDTK